MDEAQTKEQVAGMRFAAELRRQFETLPESASTARTPRTLRPSRVRRRWLVLAALISTSGIAAAVLVGIPGLRGGRLAAPEPASAADLMMAKLSTAYSTAATLSGELKFRMYRDYFGGALERSGRFVATAAGSLRTETVNEAVADPEMDDSGVGAVHIVAYDAERHRCASLVDPVGPTASYYVTTNASPDTIGSPEDSPFAYRASVERLRAAIAEGDADVVVSEGTYDGRAVWLAAWTSNHASDGAAFWYTHEMAVDKETGLVLHYRIESHGAQDHGYEELWISNLKVDEPVAAGAFELRPPADARRSSSDAGYRFGALGELGDTLGFSPVVPAEVPAGYTLAQAAAAPRGGSLADALWPHSRPAGMHDGGSAGDVPQCLRLWYRRGFDVISLRVAPVLPSDEPVSQRQITAWLRRPSSTALRATVLREGALAGSTAYGWSSVQETGLLIVSDALTVSVTGDSTLAELIDLANSLRRL